jgi:hypothetical protein
MEIRDTRMSLEKMDSALNESFQAIEFCIPKGLLQPALQIIYATFDILGWLDRPQKPSPNKRGVKFNFTKWVKLYAIKGADYRSIDLFAARCAVLHEGTPNSDLSRAGKAKRVLYCWGNAKPELLEEEARRRKEFTKVVIIDVDYLYKSLRDGYAQFRRDLKPGSMRAKRVASRAAEMYSQMIIERDGTPKIVR